MNGAQILGIFLVILVVVVICSSIRVVPQAHAYVIERLGTYNTTWSAGLHLKTPLIDKVAHRISMKEQVVDFAPRCGLIQSYSSRSQIRSCLHTAWRSRSWRLRI